MWDRLVDIQVVEQMDKDHGDDGHGDQVLGLEK
jgi:hypothetical protein